VKITLDLPPELWHEIADALDDLSDEKRKSGQEKTAELLLTAANDIETELD
jgi:hypothetical protein